MPTLAIDVDRDKLHAFCQKWKITEFALFGSVVRPEEFREDSDVDVLVRFADDAGWSLLHMVDMKEELEAIFGREVDLLSLRGVERSIRYLSGASQFSVRRCSLRSRSDRVFLLDIRTSIDLISRYVNGIDLQALEST